MKKVLTANLITVMAALFAVLAFGGATALAAPGSADDVYGSSASAVGDVSSVDGGGAGAGGGTSADSDGASVTDASSPAPGDTSQNIETSKSGGGSGGGQCSAGGSGQAGSDQTDDPAQPDDTSRGPVTADIIVNNTGLTILYEYNGANTGVWTFDANSGGTGLVPPTLDWSSGPGNWEWGRSKAIQVDNNGDGNTELAIFYDYGNANTGLWLCDAASGGGFTTPHYVWSSGPGNWEWGRSKITTSDYNGDGKTEIDVLYDYGNANTGLWMFDPTPTGFSAPRFILATGAGNWEWGRSKLTSSDYDNDGKTELAVLYNYNNAQSGLWVFDPNSTGYNPGRPVWFSGAGNWEWSRSKLVTTDYNGDGKTELTVLYCYEQAKSGLWVFEPNSTGYNTPHPVWFSGSGNWEWSRSRLGTLDYNGDGKTELAIFYGYNGAQTGIWLFDTNSGGFNAPRPEWFSGAGNWEWLRTKLPNAEHFTPRVYPVAITFMDVSIANQTLTVYCVQIKELEDRYYVQEEAPYFTTLVCTGRPGYDTPTGAYSILSKHRTVSMQGDGYYVADVPFTMWFIGTMYAVHGAPWVPESDFGYQRSHGCINVPMAQAQWLYENIPVGTPLYVHY